MFDVNFFGVFYGVFSNRSFWSRCQVFLCSFALETASQQPTCSLTTLILSLIIRHIESLQSFKVPKAMIEYQEAETGEIDVFLNLGMSDESKQKKMTEMRCKTNRRSKGGKPQTQIYPS